MMLGKLCCRLPVFHISRGVSQQLASISGWDLQVAAGAMEGFVQERPSCAVDAIHNFGGFARLSREDPGNRVDSGRSTVFPDSETFDRRRRRRAQRQTIYGVQRRWQEEAVWRKTQRSTAFL